jgi:hypothetical protein
MLVHNFHPLIILKVKINFMNMNINLSILVGVVVLRVVFYQTLLFY